MDERTCGWCSGPLPSGRRRYCSPNCLRLGHARDKRDRYVSGTYNKPTAKDRRPCWWCGQEFDYHPKVRIKFCSLDCSYAAKSEGASCPVPWRECAECGAAFVSLRPRQRCTPCRSHVGLRDKSAVATCEGCARPFTYTWRTKPRRFCSDECYRNTPTHRDAKRMAKDRRRLRKRNAYVEDVWRSRIYQRDGWRCGVCGQKVDRSAVVPHPMAATLDHIVPLAEGGTHEPANVRCAHFLCNSRRGARGGGEQLRLIG